MVKAPPAARLAHPAAPFPPVDFGNQRDAGGLAATPLRAAALGAVCALALSCGGGEGRTREASIPGSASFAPLAAHGRDRRGAVLAPDEQEAYVRDLLDSRKARDDFFRTSSDSPVPPAERAGFPPLEYYPVDPAWRFVVPVTFDASPRRLTTLTSTGEERPVMKVGSVKFEAGGRGATLQVYRTFDHPAGDSTLWVPFIDAGAGRETYPAGRYLDVQPQSDGTLVLDFNLAYNPYCAYGFDYSCPVAPRENRLPFRVTAGERGFHR